MSSVVPVTAELILQRDKFLQQLREMEAELKRVQASVGTVTVQAQTAPAVTTINNLIQNFNTTNVTIPIKVDTTIAQTQINQFLASTTNQVNNTANNAGGGGPGGAGPGGRGGIRGLGGRFGALMAIRAGWDVGEAALDLGETAYQYESNPFEMTDKAKSKLYKSKVGSDGQITREEDVTQMGDTKLDAFRVETQKAVSKLPLLGRDIEEFGDGFYRFFNAIHNKFAPGGSGKFQSEYGAAEETMESVKVQEEHTLILGQQTAIRKRLNESMEKEIGHLRDDASVRNESGLTRLSTMANLSRRDLDEMLSKPEYHIGFNAKNPLSVEAQSYHDAKLQDIDAKLKESIAKDNEHEQFALLMQQNETENISARLTRDPDIIARGKLDYRLNSERARIVREEGGNSPVLNQFDKNAAMERGELDREQNLKREEDAKTSAMKVVQIRASAQEDELRSQGKTYEAEVIASRTSTQEKIANLDKEAMAAADGSAKRMQLLDQAVAVEAAGKQKLIDLDREHERDLRRQAIGVNATLGDTAANYQRAAGHNDAAQQIELQNKQQQEMSNLLNDPKHTADQVAALQGKQASEVMNQMSSNTRQATAFTEQARQVQMQALHQTERVERERIKFEFEGEYGVDGKGELGGSIGEAGANTEKGRALRQLENAQLAAMRRDTPEFMGGPQQAWRAMAFSQHGITRGGESTNASNLDMAHFQRNLHASNPNMTGMEWRSAIADHRRNPGGHDALAQFEHGVESKKDGADKLSDALNNFANRSLRVALFDM